MKGTKGYMDIGSIFDEIFEAARDFHDEFRKNFNARGCYEGQRNEGPGTEGRRRENPWFFDESIDYYPNYSYPHMNVFMTQDRSLVFEFALAGFDEKDISLTFQGDYMVFSASIPPAGMPGASASTDGSYAHPDENVRYFKRRLKMKDIERQKYFVPLDKYAQEKVKAIFRNGILRVSIPPKEETDQTSGIKIEIVTDSE